MCTHEGSIPTARGQAVHPLFEDGKNSSIVFVNFFDTEIIINIFEDMRKKYKY